MAVDYVDILELGQDFTVVVQENVTGGFLNGESFSYTSVIARDNGGEVEIPRVLQLNIFGINALDQPIVNFFAIAYSNNCLTFPVLEEGNSAGWTRFVRSLRDFSLGVFIYLPLLLTHDQNTFGFYFVLTQTQLENPSKEFCPAAPEPAVTDPPLTPAPTTAPLPDTPAPTPTPATGAPTPAPVDPVTEAPVDPATDAPVEPPTEPPVDAPTEPPVDPPTEPPVDAPTEPPVEPPTEPPVDAPTEPPVEPPTEPPVDAPTDPPVVAPIPKPPTDIDLSMSMFVSTDYMSMGFMSMSMGYDGDLDSLMAAMGKKGKKKKGDEPMSMSMGYDEDLDSLMAAMEFGRSSAPAKKGKKKGDARRLRLSRPYVEV